MQTALDDAGKLARTDRDIAEVERRVARQLAFIGALAAKGFDTRLAETLLRLMRRDLDAMRGHRRALLGGRGPAPSPARPAGAAARRPGRAMARPCPAAPAPDLPRPGAGAAGPILVWESLPNRALIARTEGHLLVVRPRGARPVAFRFAVLKTLPENGGLLHVAHGGERTAREAMLAAEGALSRLRVAPHPCP